MDTLLAGLELARNELLLFAGIGLLLGGLDDLSIDLLYACRKTWRDLTVYRRFPRMCSRDLPPPGRTGPMAILIPAWDEADVIGPMLRRCLTLWSREDLHIFVGVYPNDPATALAAAGVVSEAERSRVSIVANPAPGPTTKADCLNRLWVALESWEVAQGRRVRAVVLHDAEQVVSVVPRKTSLDFASRISPRFRELYAVASFWGKNMRSKKWRLMEHSGFINQLK